MDLRHDDRVLTLNVRLVRETMGPEERTRLCAAVAELLAELGIESVRAAKGAAPRQAA